MQSALTADEASLNLHEPFGKAGNKEALKHLTRKLISRNRWLEGIAIKHLDDGYMMVVASVLTTQLNTDLEKFLRMVLKRGWYIIGITRDPVDVVISLFSAIQSGKWHLTRQEHPIPVLTPNLLTLGLGDDIEGKKRLVAKIHSYNCQITEASKNLGFPLLDYEDCLRDTSNHPRAQQIILNHYTNIQLNLKNSSIRRNPKQIFAHSDNAAIKELRDYFMQLKNNAQS